MSMLAEKKRKQKWSLNPRGKDWSEDSNKFGQKMLEKMGWSKGKGLGAKENGITEHVRVAYKNDSKGMGYKDNGDQWTQHEQNFTELLKNLGGNVNEDITLKSLEKKSQSSKKRVHYHKFTRGKDLSRYSDKDLANIFGKKSLKNDFKESVKIETKIENTTVENDMLLNKGSMMDYFKNKMSNFGKKSSGYTIGTNGVLQKDEIVEEHNFVGLGYNDDQKNKKRKNREEITVLSPKKKLKTDDNLGITNAAFNPMSTPVKFEKHTLMSISEENNIISDEVDVKIKQKKKKQKIVEETIEEVTPPKKKKSKKNRDNLAIDNPTFNESCVEEKSEFLEEFEVKRKKKHKKNKVQGIENPNLNISEENESIDLMLNIVSTPVSNTKKNKNVRFSDVNEQIIIPNLDEIREISEKNELYDINTKVISSSLENEDISFNMEKIDNIDFNNVKKNKKKRKLGIQNAAFDETSLKVEEMSNKIQNMEAQVENDINELKTKNFEYYVGEISNSQNSTPIRLPCGASKLPFQGAKINTITPRYIQNMTGSKKSYKHLIKGDIIVDFKHSNLHEIEGYAISNNS